ncbi:MAG TPA: secretin N-terminal domain-containing protein [Gemmataceae bacterium]|nr:secretin N-terminal domain-containing protein [Gemmataceae bacterium]
MTFRRLPVLLALLLGLLALDVGSAQQPPKERQKKAPASDAAKLQQRLTELETQIEKLTKELLRLRAELKAPAVDAGPADKTHLQIFPLRTAKAPEIAKALQDLFQGTTVRIAGEPGSNTVLVRGTRLEIDAIAPLIARLEALAEDRIAAQRRERAPEQPKERRKLP